MTRTRMGTDVVVVGTGMAGLVSAVRALEHDADVIVLEKGPRIGGKTVWSAGAMMVDEDRPPRIETHEPFEESVEWLAEQGVNVTAMSLDVPWGGKEVDTWDFAERMADRIDEMGGEVLLETPFKELLTDTQGEIAGAVAHGDEGPIEIDAPCVVLATGGFNANERLIEQYVTEHTDELVLRGDPWSTGDGFLAAQDVGAKTTTGLGKFDGHPMIAPPATFTPEEFEDATQYYGARSVALDRRGRRFVDESVDVFERQLIDAMAKEAGGKAVLVVDADIYGDSWVNGRVEGMIERAREFGGLVLEAGTLADLGERLSAEGIDGERAVETIRSFNAAVENGRGARLDPPRERYRDPIDEPPFYAVDVRPGLTFTMGGLDVNGNAEVLCRSASTTTLSADTVKSDDRVRAPIKGLYATGLDIGNPNPGYYVAGGLSMALVSGRIAGKHAAERARSRE